MRPMMPLAHSMVGLPRRGVAAVLLAAWLLAAGLLGTDPPAAAQAVTTLVSNTGQPSNNVATEIRATSFTTGTGTYTLSSVGIFLVTDSGATPVVAIYGDSGGNPGTTLVATMNNPGSLTAAGVNTFTAPANTMLSASTTYWVVTSNSAATNGTGFQVGAITNTNLDSGTAAGWSIGGARFKSDIADTSWTTSSSRTRFQILGTGGTPTNNAPTVANTIPNQAATVATPFSYVFLANTFHDVDGDTLTYMATQSDDTALPTWLTFAATTRIFSGTPAAADVGTVPVKVTASDGNGGAVSDTFDIEVSAAADTTSPTLSSSVISGAGLIVELFFSENLQQSNPPLAAAFTVTADANAVTVSIGALNPAFPTLIPISVSPTIRQGQAVVVTYTDPTGGDDANAIQDTAGNDAATFTTGSGGVPPVTNASTVVAATAPAAPTGLTATASGTTTINLSWTAPGNNGGAAITGYKIEVSSDGASWSDLVADTTSTATTYPHTGLTAGATRHYRVSAINTVGAGGASNISRASLTAEVPTSWSLKPAGMAGGDEFRLLFLSSTKRAGDSSDIAVYNTFIQNLAAAGHADIRAYSAGFSAVGCTGAVDARDNTGTTGTGVPIYWLNGATVAYDYADFYDGSWDNQTNNKNESGADGLDASLNNNFPLTGCKHDGTEDFIRALSVALGTAELAGVGVGQPFNSGPLSSSSVAFINTPHPMYGLSAVLRVAGSAFAVAAPPTDLSARPRGDTKITLTWSAPRLTGGTPITGYKIEVSSDGASWADLVPDTTSPATTYEHTGLTLGDRRYYRVSAINVVGASNASNVSRATTSLPRVSIRDQVVPEGIGTAEIRVTLNQPADTTLSVPWTATNGDAKSPGDYTAGQGELIFAPEATEATISIPIANDTEAAEGSESFLVVLGPGDGYKRLHGGAAVVSILDNDDDGPAPIRATVNGRTLVVTYNKVLDIRSTPYMDRFDVRAADDTVIGAVDTVIVSGSTVTLTLATAVAAGQTVSLGYGRPADDPIKDEMGNRAVSFTRWYVTNSTAGATPTVPGAPTGLSATSGGTTTIDLSWTAPGNDGGSAITGYKIEVSSDSGSSWTDLDPNTRDTGTTHEHTGLAAGDTRHYRVSAINMVGTGGYSGSDSATTGTTATEPGVPTGLSATSGGTTQINLSWTAPGNNGGSAITGYKIEVSSDGGTNWTDLVTDTASPATTHEHIGLTTGDTRHYRVSAINMVGTGGYSGTDNATAGATATAPAAPTGLTATASGTTRINLSWTAPANNGGSAITGYKIEVSSDAGSSWTDLVADTTSTATTYPHTGLAAGATRHYRVSAINTAGTGGYSNVANAATGTTGGGGGGGGGGGFVGGGGGGGGGGPSPSEVDFEWNVKRDIEDLAAGNTMATGIWSDGETLWVADNADGAGDAVYAYDLATGARLEAREFELDNANRAPRGIWSDRATVWVSDSGRERLFAYDLATGERVEAREIVLDEDNGDTRGIWSDDATMWVLDGGRDVAVYRYDLATGELIDRYALDDASDDPHGIWSDGVTVWVSDHGDKRLFAYRLDDGELVRNSGEEFTELSGASNNSPRGIWSDGDVMYVADESDGRVYTYNMPDAIDTRLASLTLSGVEIGEFSPAQTEYEGVADDGVTETTVEAEAAQSGASLAIDPADADAAAAGRQVAVEGGAEITVTVTSADRSREKTYRVRLGQEEVAETAPKEATGPAADCLRGAVAVGFSLVVYGGGSVEDLDACAESRNVAAVYALDGGEYVSYVLGAPGLVNDRFGELYARGVPALTPLIASSDGPATAAPVAAGVTGPWPDCLRGEIVEGFNLVLYEGGSVGDLDACAKEAGLASLYVLDDGVWVSYILGAPEFVNREFRGLYAGGVPAGTPLTARSDGPSSTN